MEVLLVHENKSVQGVLTFAIESFSGFKSRSVTTASEAFDLLMDDRSVDLIICENSAKSAKLFKFLLSVGTPIPCILIEPNEGLAPPLFPDLKVLAQLRPNKLAEGIQTTLTQAIFDGLFSGTNDHSDYCRIRTDLLLRVTPLEADIFIQLSKIKMVRLYQKGDVFDLSDLDKIQNKKKIDYLYLKQSDAPLFISKFNKTLAHLLTVNRLTPPEVPQLAISVHEACVELGESIGFTPEVQEMVKQNIKAVTKGVEQNENLKSLLDRILADEANYVPAHSVTVAHVACAIARQMGWEAESTYDKLAFAAFFHDISLKNPQLATIDHVDEFRDNSHHFTEADKRAFIAHPIESSQFTNQFEELPPDVDTIILQHHERPDGSGHPRKLTATTISPMAAVFITAHDIVQCYFRKTATIDEVIEKYAREYKSGNFKRVVEVLGAMKAEWK
jgi:hypothetical protein